MSGGGGKKLTDAITGAANAAKPTIASLNPTSTVQPFMPGMDQTIANQLAAGFGGNPQDFLSAFSQVYSPMQVPQNATFTDLASAEKSKSNSSSSETTVMKNGREYRKTASGGYVPK